MAEMWRPAPNANVTWGGNEMGYGLGWAVRYLHFAIMDVVTVVYFSKLRFLV